MHPILIQIGHFSVYSYGAMFALGFAAAFFLIVRNAPRYNFEKDTIGNLLFAALLGGIAGARALYVLLHISYYMRHPLEILNLTRGGLVWYGGNLGGLAAFVWYAAKRKLKIWNAADLFVPYIALAQSIGRIGCFLNGCCYGIASSPSYPLGVVFPGSGAVLHPTQIYSSLALLVVYVILRIWQEKRRFPGEICLGYFMLYPLERFLMEFLRGDNIRIFLGLTMSQIISVVVFFIAAPIFTYKASKWRTSRSDLK